MSTATSHAKPGRFARIRRTRKPAPVPQERGSHPYPETGAGDSAPIVTVTERALREPVASAAAPPEWWNQPGALPQDPHPDSTPSAADTSADQVIARPWVSADLANARPGTAPALARDGAPETPRPLLFLRRGRPGGGFGDSWYLSGSPWCAGAVHVDGHALGEVRMGTAPDGSPIFLAGDRAGLDAAALAIAVARDHLVYAPLTGAALPPPPAELAAVTAEVAPAEGEQDASQPGADLEPEGGEAA